MGFRLSDLVILALLDFAVDDGRLVFVRNLVRIEDDIAVDIALCVSDLLFWLALYC